MRVISGNLKGKKILQPLDKNTRPLKDMAKEAIFNVINHSNKFSTEIINSKILDLFSGVGSFGLECISRKASHVTFVESYSKTLKILQTNLEKLSSQKNYKILTDDIFENNFFKNLNCKYNIIFLDPPYKEKKIKDLLNNIHKEEILEDNGLIVIHRNKKDKDEFPPNFEIIDEKIYGISKIFFGVLN